MLLTLALALLAALVLVTVVVPLVRSARSMPERAAFDRAVYRDQLKELERDVARGLVGEDQAATARLEIERRLLATDTAPAATTRNAGSPPIAAVLALAISIAALGLYLALGSPGVPDQPYAARGPERSLIAANGQLDLDKTAAALEEKLASDPGSAEGWLLLARTQAARSQWQKSAEAYRRAMVLTKGRPDVAAAYGEMLVMAADGIVTPAARDAFTAAVARDPANAAARYYLALAAAQAGDARTAIDGWQKLAAEAPADSPLRAELHQRIEEAAKAADMPVPALAAPAPRAAPGPAAPDLTAAANMTPEQRQQMIRGMVEGLATKLAAHPDDVEGWQRLGRAYGVLGERDKAADAYDHAIKLRPDDPAIPLAAAEALLAGHKPEEPVPERAVALLQRAEAIEPGQPMVLWYLGLASAQARDFAKASGYWQRLLAVIPPDSEEHKTVSAAIAALQEK